MLCPECTRQGLAESGERMLGQGMAGAGAWMGQTTSLCLFLHFCGIRVLSVLRGGGPAMHVQLYSHTGTGKLETHSPPRSCTSRKGSYSVGLLGDFNQEMHLCLLLWLAPPGPGAPRRTAATALANRNQWGEEKQKQRPQDLPGSANVCRLHLPNTAPPKAWLGHASELHGPTDSSFGK